MPFDGRRQTPPLITAEHVASIAAEPDPVLRNVRITQSYHDLSVAIGAHLGHRDACWSAFAVWASKSAGRYIRGEWLRPELRRVLAQLELASEPRIAAVDEHVRGLLADGNQLVYADIAPVFVQLLELLHTPEPERPARLAGMLAGFVPGPVEHGGQDALGRALRAFVDAAARPEGPRRAQAILLANLLIGAHEQYRLQDVLAGVLDVAWTLTPMSATPWQREVRRRFAGWLRQRLTRRAVRLRLPGTVLAVGRDVPPLADGAMFPADLRRVEEPELEALLRRFDRTPNTTEGSAAADWSDYGDRMNYVVDMFRSRQQTESLWHPPFTSHQAAAIRDGHVPAGVL